MSAPAPLPVEQVGPYRVLRAIGAGGSARIDLARIDRAYGFQRHVVLKRPLEHLRDDAAVAASLHREARIGGRLRHPNLIAVLDAGIHDGYDYLVLEYIHGTSLRGLMQTQADRPHVVREVPIAAALAIAVDIARGLDAAHELRDETGAPLGLVHRDISPGNVLLALDGSVKVSDFGIAKETRVSTLSGSMHGTVTYMAPEQCRGHAFDRRADIFSLGVILYELLTHRRLFLADNDVASLHRVLSGDVTRPRALVPTLSPELEQIAMTALAADPAARFATAREFADALEGFAARDGIVFGARLVARSVEEVAGARQAPWIASTTVVDPPRRAEPSLVAVIESLEPGDEIGLQFGPSDPRTLEEGEVPSSPAATRPIPAHRSRRRGLAPWATVCAVLGIVIAVAATRSHHHDRTVHVQAPHVQAPATPVVATPPAQPADMPVSAPPPAAPISAPPPAAVPAPAPTPVPAPAPAPVKISRHHSTHAPVAGSTPQAVAPPPAPEPAGSARPPARVEWNPTMLLPSDKPTPDKSK